MAHLPRTVCFVSDRTGVTTETVGHALLSRFEAIRLEAVTMPFVLSTTAARGVVMRIDTIAAAQHAKPIVFCTIVDEEVRGVIKQANALVIDLFGNIGELERELGPRRASPRRQCTAPRAIRPTPRASARRITRSPTTTAREPRITARRT